MASLLELDNLVNNAPNLKKRFKAARMKAAWDIQNESADAANHANREAWANAVFSNYDWNLDFEFRKFLSNPSIQAAGDGATDSDIQFVVNSLIIPVSG